MKHNTNIEFAAETAAQTATKTGTPWKNERVSAYQDWVFKSEYADRKLRFPPGLTWMRILPAFEGSAGWLLGVHAIEFAGGRFAHPRTVKRNAKCAFDHAYLWARGNAPTALYSKANKQGVRLLTKPLAAFWAAVEEGGRTVARLYLGSAYDGSRGGAPGLGWQIWQKTREKDEAGNLVADPAHPVNGVLVGVEKTQAAGAQYPSYRLQIGRQPAPAADCIARMGPEEAAALCPLENTIRALNLEEEWECLAKVMSPERAQAVRASLADVG